MRTPLVIIFLATLIGMGLASAATSPSQNLPKIGTAGGGLISPAEEYAIGRQIVSEIRKSGGMLADPLLTEYIRELGFSLSAPNNEDGDPYDFFIIRDRTINAFALPGGFIGVNYGLILETENESELAGVMAHEVAHVSPWYFGAIPTGGPDGTVFSVRMLQDSPAHLNDGGTLVFPVLSLSCSDEILTVARQVYGEKLERVVLKMIPFNSELESNLDLLVRLKSEGIIDFIRKRSRYLWTLEIYRAYL